MDQDCDTLDLYFLSLNSQIKIHFLQGVYISMQADFFAHEKNTTIVTFRGKKSILFPHIGKTVIDPKFDEYILKNIYNIKLQILVLFMQICTEHIYIIYFYVVLVQQCHHDPKILQYNKRNHLLKNRNTYYWE
ncbi:hypothetical protein ACJX0J_006191 [Zea mays]